MENNAEESLLSWAHVLGRRELQLCLVMAPSVNAAGSLIEVGYRWRLHGGRDTWADSEVMGKSPSHRDLKGRGDVMGTRLLYSGNQRKKRVLGAAEWWGEVRKNGRASSQRTSYRGWVCYKMESWMVYAGSDVIWFTLLKDLSAWTVENQTQWKGRGARRLADLCRH